MPFRRAPENLLLRSAGSAGRPNLLGKLEYITFDAGQRLWSPGDPVPSFLFPLRGIVSLQLAAAPGKQGDVALVGREGFLDVPAYLGAQSANMIAVAITAGDALAMPSRVFRSYLDRPIFRTSVELYVQSFVMMLAHMSLCNRVHVLEQVCAARLLLMQDRTQADSFQVTQDFFSRLLGVRRASVSRAAAQLQKRGAIQYDRRGRLTILNRSQLEKASCSCYVALKRNFDSLVATQGGW